MIALGAVVCLALMTGNEICVAAFINPVLRQLPEQQQTPFLRRSAKQLGFIMPFWYIASLALTVLAAFRHQGGLNLALWSAVLQVCIIVLTITMLVPINNRLSKLREDETGWTAAARRWDGLHRIRVVLLLMSLAMLTALVRSLLSAPSR